MTCGGVSVFNNVEQTLVPQGLETMYIQELWKTLHLYCYLQMFCFSPVSEVIYVITSAVKDVCGKPPSERNFLDKYGRICLCLDEIVWKVRRHAKQSVILNNKN